MTVHVYQTYLKEEFSRRRQRNSSYSLRAYSRDLGVPSSKLSQYLSGSCGISGQKASSIASRLKLSPLEIELFVFSAEAAHARDPLTRQRAKERLKAMLEQLFTQVNMEKFALIRDWYHLAILELTETAGFESSVSWIARALSVPECHIQEATDRLVKMNLLDCSTLPWKQTQRDFETPGDFSSRAVRDYHKQMMSLVESRFEDIELHKRELGSVLCAIDSTLIPEMKTLIRRFQREAAAIVERSQNKDSVYALNFQLMPIYEGNVE